MKFNYYLVPDAIVSGLGLKDFRIDDGKGNYILSQSDLDPYGIDKALNEGAKEITTDEVNEIINNKKQTI